MDNFIVRIYRRDAHAGRNMHMTGLVETVGCDGVNVFNNSEELWNILCNQSAQQPMWKEHKKKDKE